MTRKKIDTMQDLAGEIRVSRPTLSRYFQDPGTVSPRMREKIERGLSAVDYVPNFFAVQLARRGEGLVGIVIPSLTDVFQASMFEAAERALAERGHRLILQSSGNDVAGEDRAIDTLRSMNVNGILLAPVAAPNRLPRLREIVRSVPVVLIDSGVEGAEGYLDDVGIDNRQGIELILDYLIREGRNPVYLTMPCVNRNATERRAAYEAVMLENELEPRFVESGPPVGWNFEEYGYRTMARCFAEGRHVADTLICASDRIATGAMKAAHQFKLFQPGTRRFGIAGHDNDLLARFLHPGLTTVEQDLGRIAETAVEILLARVKDPAGASVPIRSRRIPGRLIVRESA
ncbi:DNA-binding LacI/PurR family transcriptional regulator [Palleronia aestuarii]|uniref:DNA-binding LacI/PurR family transcriptional regulator n=1 Tax=Palleronia aestuarii TaxID=568105 RepID=A0A2W7N195_9RHOB|nr:LacI family DNA-binding transcriptional regulator [Palleronia aestuarii]PZX13751.1 DNA-binding LacI/PurR family transcriptional regulator [Palleronia aestuarii]